MLRRDLRASSGAGAACASGAGAACAKWRGCHAPIYWRGSALSHRINSQGMPKTAVESPAHPFGAWRAQFPLLAHAIPMNNCSQGPQSLRARAAALAFLDAWNQRGMDWDEWLEAVQGAKAAFAALINASVRDIAVFSSVSDATSAFMSALDFSGDRNVVVASEAEFPTIGHVALAQAPRGALVRWVPLRDGHIDSGGYHTLVREDTRVVCATHAHFVTGALQDIAAITQLAQSFGALALVDAYQSIGAVPIDVARWGVDALVAGTQKYLLGTPGIAFLYVRSGLVEQLHPTVTGWFGRAQPFAFDVGRLDWASGAARFDTGTPPAINAYIARASMELIGEVGVDGIREWTQVLSDRLVRGAHARGLAVLGPVDAAAKGPTTALIIDGDSAAIERRMRERGVIASARGPVIRLAPHFFTTLDECDQALDALVRAMRA